MTLRSFRTRLLGHTSCSIFSLVRSGASGHSFTMSYAPDCRMRLLRPLVVIHQQAGGDGAVSDAPDRHPIRIDVVTLGEQIEGACRAASTACGPTSRLGPEDLP